MEVLLVNQTEVKALLDMEAVLGAVEEAYREKALGSVQMPPKIYLFYEKYNGDLRVMPSYLEGTDKSGVKIVNVHPDNPAKHNLPSVMAVFVLVDPVTGRPLAIMDGTAITAYRTGAGSGIATKYLSRGESTTLALVGAGVQAPPQLEAIKRVRAIEEVRVYDKDRIRADNLVKQMRPTGLRLAVCKDLRECVQDADIVSTLTPAREPIIRDEWIRQGTHINAVGADAPGKQELDPRLLNRSRIVVDDWSQASHSGEINVPLTKGLISKEDVYGEIGEIIIGKKKGRESPSEITIFDTTGLSIQDVATAAMVYEAAKSKGIGRYVEL